MAVNKRGRRYKLTPRRKAAILKAQSVSARKRRGRVIRGLTVVAVTGAAAGFAAHSMRKSRNKSTVGKELDVIRIAPRISRNEYGNISRAFFDNVGKPLNPIDLGKQEFKRRKRKLPNYRESEQQRLRKEKQRLKENYKARRKYWKNKPVPKVPRKSRRKKG